MIVGFVPVAVAIKEIDFPQELASLFSIMFEGQLITGVVQRGALISKLLNLLEPAYGLFEGSPSKTAFKPLFPLYVPIP